MKKYDKRLNDLKAVNTELSRVYNDYRNGSIKENEAKTSVGILSKKADVLRVIETLDMEKERLAIDKAKTYGITNEELEDDGYEEATKELKDIEAFDKKIIESGIVSVD